jgi:hypothetical protein
VTSTRVALVAGALAIIVACGSDRPPAAGGTIDGPTSSSSGGTTTPSDGGTGDAGDAGLGRSQCTNGIDDDGDGKIDSDDPECTGPLDNDEGTFGTGIAGDNSDPCKQDCFFDGNSGEGNDGCSRSLGCDPLKPGGAACDGDGDGGTIDPLSSACTAPQTAFCQSQCVPLSPNGCDCFGCCAFAFLGNTVNVRLVDTCKVDLLGDENKCPRCTPEPSCANDCTGCEVCTSRTLPAECQIPTCEGGRQPCTSTSPCPNGQYCMTGCCVEILR